MRSVSIRLALLLAVMPQIHVAAQHLTLEEIETAAPTGRATLSPDGTTLAMVHDRQITLMPASGGWPEPLTGSAEGKSELSWSPDGKRIAYAGQGSIWVIAAAGGEPVRLTNAPAGPGDPRLAGDHTPTWSPNGRWILFLSGRRGGSDLMAVSADGNVTSFLTAPDAERDDAHWSPDGKEIAYVEITKEHFSGSLCVMDFDESSGQPKAAPHTLYSSPVDRGGGWAMHGVVWSPNGKTLTVVLQNSGWDHIYLIGASGGTPQQITDGAFSDGSPQFSPDGKSLAFTSSREGTLEESNVWVMPASGGPAHLVAKFDVPGYSILQQWTHDGQKLFFYHESPRETGDLFVANADGSGKPVALTNTTPKYLAQAVMPERITWKSADGREIAGLLYSPPGPHEKNSLPLVEWIHGGPEGEDNFGGDLWAQYLAGAGFVVLEPNYRGSNGYGEVFRNLNVEDPGGGEADDVAFGAKYLVAQGLVDPKRMAVGGISHGATMSLYMIVRYPDLYAAAIDFAGVSDRALFVERTNPHSAIRWQMKMGGSPAEKPAAYLKADILRQVDKIQTPLLVLHGENDPQVPPAEAAELVEALRSRHKTVFYFTYPHELHGVSALANEIDSWEKEIAFLEHYIKPQTGMTSTSTEAVVFPKSTVVTGPAK